MGKGKASSDTTGGAAAAAAPAAKAATNEPPQLADIDEQPSDQPMPLGLTTAETLGPRLDPILPGASHKELRVGDVIALCVQRGDRLFFVGSEGFVELGTSLRELDLTSTVPWTHLDSQWVVATKHQYDAQKNLRKASKAKRRAAAANAAETTAGGPEGGSGALGAKKGGGADALTSTSDKLMASRSKNALEEQRKARKAHEELVAANTAEKLSNAARNDEKKGTPLTYGETIQLMHVRSRKYLVFNPKRRSQSLGCYSVRLDAEGSEDAWIAISPRHSFQFEGASVHNHDLLTLHSVKRQLWLHVGRTRRARATTYTPLPPCSLISSNMRMLVFAASESVGALGKSTGTLRPASAAGPAMDEYDEVNAATTAATLQLIMLRSPSDDKAAAGGDKAGGR